MAITIHEGLIGQGEHEDPHGVAFFIAARGIEAVMQKAMHESGLTVEQLTHQPFNEDVVGGLATQAVEGIGGYITGRYPEPTEVLEAIPNGVVMSGANRIVLIRQLLLEMDGSSERGTAAREYAVANGLLEFEVGDPVVESATHDLEMKLETLLKPVLEADITNLDPATFDTGRVNAKGEPILDSKKMKIYDVTLAEAAAYQVKAQERGLTRAQATKSYWIVKSRLIDAIEAENKEE
ncbi:hypothetical protein HY857_01445 [Candidatus Saccharibacteria bacterium]|nr:hypothetical protein [Candidatus Saccharibacteria bacterium]